MSSNTLSNLSGRLETVTKSLLENEIDKTVSTFNKELKRCEHLQELLDVTKKIKSYEYEEYKTFAKEFSN